MLMVLGLKKIDLMELRLEKIVKNSKKNQNSRKIITFLFVKNQFPDKIAQKPAGMFA